MILIVAPYNGVLPENNQFLAAAKKIRSVIKVLLLIDSEVVLLNSGHQTHENRNQEYSQIQLENGKDIYVVTPVTKKNAYIGRFFNIINIPLIIETVIAKYGVPDFAWFYNGYAFEMRTASYLKIKYGVFTVLEFEDSHFARNRSYNPKPYMDWFFWRVASKRIDAAFAVNSTLLALMKSFNVPTKLLPGVVTDAVSAIAVNAPPFKSDIITVGYFGGLTTEKGADVLLRIAAVADKNIRFVITGRGDLCLEFEKMQNKIPERLRFLGAVSEADLVRAMSEVDVILNAHSVNDGVFPFKILEAVASGRLLISTVLPMEGYKWFSDAIQFYDGSENTLLALLYNARNIYETKKNISLLLLKWLKSNMMKMAWKKYSRNFGAVYIV